MPRAPLAPSGDDVAVERCMDCGTKPARALPDLTLFASIRSSHPEYHRRVADAVRMLQAGESADDVRARHGGIVLRDARAVRRAG